MSKRVCVAVLGVGLIGLDLIGKVLRSTVLDLRLAVGRDDRSLGLRRAAELGCATAVGGVRALVESGVSAEVVFDASEADCHAEHLSYLRAAGTAAGTTVIDLTPARLGTMVVPTVNGAQTRAERHVSLVSCGGQAAIPILHALARGLAIDYVEIVTTGAIASAGRATRRNLDHYLETTEAAIRAFTGVAHVKALANLSPATPPPPFRVAITALVRDAEPDLVRAAVQTAAGKVRAFAPGFAVSSLTVTGDRVIVGLEVTAARGGRLQRYAGNLDLINAAAVLLAEQRAAAPTTGELIA